MTAAPAHRSTLRRRQRLLKTSSFQAVYAAHARAADGRLVAYAMPNGLAQTRVGLSVGKRCGPSVARNRIKRFLRESFRQARHGFPAGYDIVLVPIARDYTFAEVDRAVRALVPEAIRRSRRAARPRPADAAGEGTVGG